MEAQRKLGDSARATPLRLPSGCFDTDASDVAASPDGSGSSSPRAAATSPSAVATSPRPAATNSRKVTADVFSTLTGKLVPLQERSAVGVDFGGGGASSSSSARFGTGSVRGTPRRSNCTVPSPLSTPKHEDVGKLLNAFPGFQVILASAESEGINIFAQVQQTQSDAMLSPHRGSSGMVQSPADAKRINSCLTRDFYQKPSWSNSTVPKVEAEDRRTLETMARHSRGVVMEDYMRVRAGGPSTSRSARGAVGTASVTPRELQPSRNASRNGSRPSTTPTGSQFCTTPVGSSRQSRGQSMMTHLVQAGRQTAGAL